jgi:hypothetical protein
MGLSKEMVSARREAVRTISLKDHINRPEIVLSTARQDLAAPLLDPK